MVDLYAREDEPATETFWVFPPNIQRVTQIIPGANRISYGTSTPAAIYAGYLLDGTISQRGVLPARGAGARSAVGSTSKT